MLNEKILSSAFTSFLKTEAKKDADYAKAIDKATVTLSQVVTSAFTSTAPNETDYTKERRAIIAVAFKAITVLSPALEEKKQKKKAQNLVTRAIMRACAAGTFTMPEVKGAVREQSAAVTAANDAGKALKQTVDGWLVVKGKTDDEIMRDRARVIALAKVDSKLDKACTAAFKILKEDADKKQADADKKAQTEADKKLADLRASIRAELEAELKLKK
jgi:hypothetical protein